MIIINSLWETIKFSITQFLESRGVYYFKNILPVPDSFNINSDHPIDMRLIVVGTEEDKRQLLLVSLYLNANPTIEAYSMPVKCILSIFKNAQIVKVDKGRESACCIRCKP